MWLITSYVLRLQRRKFFSRARSNLKIMLQMFLSYFCRTCVQNGHHSNRVYPRLVTMCQAYPKITISTFSLFPIPTFNPSFLFLNHRTDRSVIQLSPLSFNAACPSNLRLVFVVKFSVCFNCSNWSTTTQRFDMYFVRTKF